MLDIRILKDGLKEKNYFINKIRRKREKDRK